MSGYLHTREPDPLPCPYCEPNKNYLVFYVGPSHMEYEMMQGSISQETQTAQCGCGFGVRLFSPKGNGAVDWTEHATFENVERALILAWNSACLQLTMGK